MHIRPLLARDWSDVSAILSGALGPGALEGKLPTWEEWDARYLPTHRLVAANREGRVTAWAALEAISNRPSLAGVASISIFVEAGYRGQGFGRHLLANLITASEEAGLWTLQGYVAPQNKAALELFQDLGFRTVGRRERFFEINGAWHDAILVERRSPVVFPEADVLTQEIPEAS
ncbi:MAG: GNAT family N-acetyltransferase [Bifidobacteriaceae bacterium]|jgi:phosphinothricin acetyltransferase|nr:GNAT family N-acetyltransferase [Bifidobacteriaceae bacterium]